MISVSGFFPLFKGSPRCGKKETPGCTMDAYETRVIQTNFAYLVQQGKAEELLDDLYSAWAITLDDIERVQAQTTNSDKMRMLLMILLKKVPTIEVKTFEALVKALRGANRSDLADLLIHHRQECARNQVTNLRPGQNASVSETEPKMLLSTADCSHSNSKTNPKFLFFSGNAHGQITSVCDVKDLGMDIADGAPNTSGGEITAEPVLSKELSPPVHEVRESQERMVVSSKELRQAVDAAKGTSGQMLLAGRVFHYMIKGVFDGDKVQWHVIVTDQSTHRCVERKSPNDRRELLEECLLQFTK